jgi:hypothetical protein
MALSEPFTIPDFSSYKKNSIPGAARLFFRVLMGPRFLMH